ncbi:hypothetical protein D3C75_940020 [compost metagenome]
MKVGHSWLAKLLLRVIAGPMVRRSRSSMPATKVVTCVEQGCRVCWRENASSRCTSEEARCAALLDSSSKGARASKRDWSRR